MCHGTVHNDVGTDDFVAGARVANNKYFQKATEILYEEQDITKHNPLEEQLHAK